MSRVIDTLNFDTIYATTYFNNNTFDCYFNLSNPERNVKKIYLRSLEMLISWPNVRSVSNLSTFSFTLNSVAYSFTLQDNIYTSMTSLITDMNTALTNLLLPISVAFQLNPSNNNQLQIILGSTCTFSITSTNFSNYLLNISGTNSGLTLTGGSYLLNVDNYILLYIDNLPNRAINQNNIPASFKIPLNAASNVVFYSAQNNEFEQYIDINDPSLIITSLKIKVIDRFGGLIKSNVHYSMTLGLEKYI